MNVGKSIGYLETGLLTGFIVMCDFATPSILDRLLRAEIYRMNIEIGIRDLCGLSAEEVSAKAERLALAALKS